MESVVLEVALDSSVVITAERKSLPVARLIEAIQTAYGEIELSLSPLTVAELVHGLSDQTRPRIQHRTGGSCASSSSHAPDSLFGCQIEGQEAAMGNVLAFNDLLMAAAAIEREYAALTENLRPLRKDPLRPSPKAVAEPRFRSRCA